MKRWFKWTSEMHNYLLEHYEWIGDSKLAEMFELKFPKHYPWTKKHIEKRRNYFGLKRTAEQENYLRVQNNKDGRQKLMWESRNKMKDGEIRSWGGKEFIMVSGSVVLLRRHQVGAKKGEIVRTFEGEAKIISRKENQLLNAKRRASMPPEIKQAVKALNQLKKVINGKENTRSSRNAI